MTDNERKVCMVAMETLADPHDPVPLDSDTDLSVEFNMEWVDKLNLLSELEDRFKLPPPEDAKDDIERLDMSKVSWVVSDLAKDMEQRLSKNTQ